MTATLIPAMGTPKALPEPENVVESLLQSLLETFTSTRDLHKTLRAKEKRDHEAIKTLKGYPDSRRNYYAEKDDMDMAGEEAISLDNSAVRQEYQRGYDDLGHRFANGDVITQTEIQAQIIALQGTLVTVFLYGPTSPHPISHHLTTILSASRTASINAVNSFAAQYQRMVTTLPPAPITPPSPPYPATLPPTSSRPPSASASRSRPLSTSTELVPSRHTSTYHPSSHTQTNHTPAYPTSSHTSPTAITMPYPRPSATRSDTSTTSFSGPVSITTRAPNHGLFCLYALELQHHPSQPLAPSLASPTPYCPACNRTLNLTPGRTWEVRKTDVVLDPRGRRDSAREREVERVFRVDNRFVVKCHRAGPEGGYSCVLCARDRNCEADTVAGDVKALVRHVWMEHGARDLEGDEDIEEIREVDEFERRGGSRRSF